MKLKKINIVGLILFSGFGFGQTLPISSEGIQSNFSAKSIGAYQENSQNKLDEFYEYLTMYSAEKDAELKEQIRENIISLTKNQISIPNFTKAQSSEIDLETFLSEIENQSYQFSIKSGKSLDEIGFNQWVNSYVLWVSRKEKTIEFELEQIIYFEPKEKQFGNKTKTVWEVKLGDIQQ